MTNSLNILDYIDYRKGKIWVTESFLHEKLPFADWSISVNTIRNGTRKYRKHQSDKWENHPNNKLNRQVLINLESIEFETLTPFKSAKLQLPSKTSLLNLYKTSIQTSRKDVQSDLMDCLEDYWMSHFKGTDERYYQNRFNVNQSVGDVKANHLAQSIAILRLIHSNELCGFQNKKDLQVAIAKKVNEIGLYGKGLNSYDRIRKSLTEFKKALNDTGRDERDVVVSGHYGNQRRLKFDDLHRTVALEYYLGLVHQQKPDKWAAWNDYQNFMIRENGSSTDEVIGYSRFKQITLEKSIEDMAAKVRHGGPYYEAYIRPFVFRKSLEHSLTLVAGDGWEPGRSVSYTWRNPKSGRIEKRTGTMNVWLWYDVKSKAIVSHHIAPFENSHQVRTSFRDIIGLYGVCPRSVMTDKKWAEQQGDTVRMFQKADVFIQPKKPYSPKTNPAERINKELNKIHRYLDEYWVNMTQNHSLPSQHNEEKLRGATAMKEAEFRSMIYSIIERHNHAPYKSLNGRTPMQVFQESIDPKCRVFDPLDLTWIFGETTISTVRGYAVKFKIAGTEHTFLIESKDIRTYQRVSPKHNKVRIYFDERHLDSVDLYNMTDVKGEDESGDSYICSAINKNLVAVSPSSLEGATDNSHGKKIGWQIERGKTLDAIVEEEIQDMEDIKETMGWETATFMNTSQERFKELHSNSVAQQYRDYHQEREELEGHLVSASNSTSQKAEVLTIENKYEILKKRQEIRTKEKP